MSSQPEEFVTVAAITVTRYIANDGDLVDAVAAVDGDGDALPLAEALGMMRLAEDTLIRSRTDGD